MVSPQLAVRSQEHTVTLALSGDWVISAVPPPQQPVLDAIVGVDGVTLDTTGLGRWDSQLLAWLLKLSAQCRQAAITLDTSGLPDGVRGLLELAEAVPEQANARRSEAPQSRLTRLGLHTLAAVADIRALLAFVGEVMLGLVALLGGRARFRRGDLLAMIDACGPRALPIVTLIAVLAGLILAFVGAVQLALFGAELYIANLVALGMLREMGALMTAVIMAGRTGAAFAAQLGTMTVNNEIDALRTLGISPVEFLILPRILALTLMMPLMCLYADALGILGGAIVTVGFFDVSLVEFYTQMQQSVTLTDLTVGVIKCTVFGALIGLAGCMQGIHCGRSAAAVGDATTRAVVQSIVYIVVSDSLLTLIFDRLKV